MTREAHPALWFTHPVNECMTCELIERRDRGEAPLWDNIVRTPGWDVAHAFGTSVEGWTVLAVRRHITSVASLTDSEAAELGQLVRDVSAAIQAITRCHKTYIAQFAEHLQHPHVHFHVIPRAPELPHEHQGPRVFGLGGVPEDEAVPEPRMTAFALELRHRLAG